LNLYPTFQMVSTKEDPELQAPEHAALSAQVARFFHRANADAA
jgi:hypothetical protein